MRRLQEASYQTSTHAPYEGRNPDTFQAATAGSRREHHFTDRALLSPKEAEFGFQVVSKKLTRDPLDTFLHLAVSLVAPRSRN